MKRCAQSLVFLFLLLTTIYLLASCNGLVKKQSSDGEYDFTGIPRNLSEEMYIFKNEKELATIDSLKADRAEKLHALLHSEWEFDFEAEGYYPVEKDEKTTNYEERVQRWYENEIEDIEPLMHDTYVLLDTIASAYSFLKNSLHFSGRFEYYYFPDHCKGTHYKKHGDADFKGYSIRNMPVEERQTNLYMHLHEEGERGVVAYNQVLNYLLNNKETLDFYELYRSGKKVIHRMISKEAYEKGMKSEVNRLMMAYHDIQDDDNLLYEIAVIMRDHETKLVDPAFRDVGTYEEMVYPQFKEIIPTDSHDAIIDANSDYLLYDTARLVWYYSFWLRRAQEGNMDNIYSTLDAIKDDYAAM